MLSTRADLAWLAGLSSTLFLILLSSSSYVASLPFTAGWLVGLPIAWLLVPGFPYGFFTAADSAIYSTAVTELAPRNLVGSAQAVQSFIGFVVGTGAPVVEGSILDLSDAQSAWILVFSFNGVLAVAGIACLLGLRRVPASSVTAWKTVHNAG